MLRTYLYTILSIFHNNKKTYLPLAITFLHQNNVTNQFKKKKTGRQFVKQFRQNNFPIIVDFVSIMVGSSQNKYAKLHYFLLLSNCNERKIVLIVMRNFSFWVYSFIYIQSV